MLLGDGERYVRVPFQNEAELEQVAVSALPLRFGPAAVFLPKAKLGALGHNGTVPDGIVIDLAAKAWYLLAVERARYGLWDDIAPRVAKQVAAQAREEAHRQLLNLALDEIAQSGSLKHALQELEIDERRVHWTLHEILQQPPRVALPIDEVSPDLDEWARTFKTPVQIWRLDKYAEARTGRVLYALPDETAPNLDGAAGDEGIPELGFVQGAHLDTAAGDEGSQPRAQVGEMAEPAAQVGELAEAAFLDVPSPEPAAVVEEMAEPAFLHMPEPPPAAKAEEVAEPLFPLSPQEFRRRLNGLRGIR